MSGAAVNQKKRASGPLILSKDTFTGEGSTLIHLHTPDIGNPYLANRAIGGVYGLVNTVAPTNRASGGAYVYTSGTPYGGIFDSGIGAGPYSISFQVWPSVTSALFYTFRMPATLANGVRYGLSLVVTRGGIGLRNSAVATIGSCACAIPDGAIIRIDDDNTDTIGAIRVYINGVFVFANTVAANSAGNSYHGLFANEVGYYMDNREVSQ